ncbi:hypothetical protein DFH08DRAFT_771514 [Mycena albidolilacea]|uniref:Uncharacterized protein n=1 Tax=Mycena albidolilacea TaxID=1033008 RepID=A0AAD7EYN5_9AGAR|nr:hypothetical protein DFH08DRAFT_771514 [Mycena albidolilacea]
MDFAPAHVPEISVSLAEEETRAPEPCSPFSWSSPLVEDDDGFRPVHLTPPPSSTRFKQLSPLRPPDSPVTGQGLERERFEALLKASKERNTAVGAKKGTDLRKEIALKAHGKKQVERRALFLSKVLAPPSPTATLTPKTPPDSPAIFNYTLPSPGLVSPLALFESLNENPAYGPLSYHRKPWVEQVDFRLPTVLGKAKAEAPKPKPTAHAKPAKPIPSLDQISARLSSHGHVRTPSAEAAERKARLPAFLAQSRPTAPRLTIGVGRLQLPVRSTTPDKADNLPHMPPRSPCYPLSPNLQVTTIVVPRSSSMSPTELSESNLLALNSRERRAKDMLSTLRKRTRPSENGLPDGLSHDDPIDRKWKRRSAPAELSPRARSGFAHPVLSMPGGF